MGLEKRPETKSELKSAPSMDLERRKRINRLKKMILSAVTVLIAVLFVISGVALGRAFSTQKKLKKLEAENKSLKEELVKLSENLEASLSEQVNSDISGATEEANKQTGTDVPQTTDGTQNENGKKVYLTFDDGPSENTGAILDILKQHNVKATFFVIGKTDETSKALYRRIVEEGHSLGIHSYSHRYNLIYESLDAFKNDVLSLQAWLKEVTGKEVKLYRFPGGSSNTVSKVPIRDCIRFLSENGFVYYDWNATNGDATGKPISTEEMVSSVLTGYESNQNSTVLMHDGPGKTQTVEALPAIIERLQAGGAQILPIDENTVPSQHVKVESVMGQ